MSEPQKLDSWLEATGLRVFDDTRVMINDDLRTLTSETLPPGINLQRVGHSAFAQIVGQMRGSPLSQQQAHAQRLELSPVSFEGWVLRRSGESAVLACGQTAAEADMVGLYSVLTGKGHMFGNLSPSVPERLGVGCGSDTFGYPCFPNGSKPVVVLVTDSPFHNGPNPSMYPYDYDAAKMGMKRCPSP